MNTCLAFIEKNKANFILKNQGMFLLCKRKKDSYTRGDQKVRGKVLLHRIAFIDCNENS